MDIQTLPEWTTEEATEYYKKQGRKSFSTAYLESREWMLKNGAAKATRGYREYIKCDDGNFRPLGKPLARVKKRAKALGGSTPLSPPVSTQTKKYIETKAKRYGKAKTTGKIWNELAELVK